MAIYDTKEQPFGNTVVEDNNFIMDESNQGASARFVKQSIAGKTIRYQKGKNKVMISK